MDKSALLMRSQEKTAENVMKMSTALIILGGLSCRGGSWWYCRQYTCSGNDGDKRWLQQGLRSKPSRTKSNEHISVWPRFESACRQSEHGILNITQNANRECTLYSSISSQRASALYIPATYLKSPILTLLFLLLPKRVQHACRSRSHCHRHRSTFKFSVRLCLHHSILQWLVST